MKRLFIAFALVSFAVTALFAQAVQPSLMVFPSNAWCHQNGFEKTVVKANGKEVRVQEYDKALIDNKDLGPAIRMIGKLMADRGFQLIDLEQNLKSQDLEAALDNASDEDIEMTAYDQLIATAGPDIAMHINYYTEQMGPRVTIYYDLTGFDAYTSKQIASTGLIKYGPTMSAPLQDLLQEAVIGSIDAFNAQLMQHFMDMQEKGREISIRINTISGWEDGLETEIDGTELTEIIEDWVNANCVAGRNHQKSASESSMVYDSARIPLFNEKGKAVQAKQWLNGLRKKLKDLGVPCKVKTRGLGQAQLVIGE
ncbi:MAG: hypothetical protein J5612_05900 [Paludibacteraceae bacterium]|nr:hypothetical protein [Paludibacteraceae bacterium]